MLLNKKKYYLISFAEGAAVMTAEITGAKLLAPFYGSSLYVWSSVMAITLGGLAAGYFIGGQLSKRCNKQKIVLIVLIAAVCCLCLMPFLTPLFYLFSKHTSLITAVIGSVLFLLFPTMLCMGATSPLIISILTQDINRSGENSGKIYATSTIGGILSTFLCGFYLIPNFGVTSTLLVFALLLALSSLLLLPDILNKKIFISFILPLCFCFYGFITHKNHKNTIYKTEGILGKLEIRDEPEPSNPNIIIRKLLINNIIQTEMNLQNNTSGFEYVNLLIKNINYLPSHKALLLGLGGGIVANTLQQHQFKVTAVEFDERIIEMAKRYFYLDKNIKTVCDDARHFINENNNVYNLIMFDIFKAEEQPAHVITKESLIKIKTVLADSGMLVINSNGYLNSDKGKGTQCLLATLKNAGFNIKICATSTVEDYRNLLIFASLQPMAFTLHNEVSPLIFTNLETINTDNFPVLEYLNADANQAWRSNYLQNYILQH